MKHHCYDMLVAIYLNNPVGRDWVELLEANNPTDITHPGFIHTFFR